MPTYDYHCEACDHTFELYQPITAKPVRKCPSCNARRVVRLIGTGGGIIFKGSGFYHTDYRSAEYKKAAETDQKSRGTASSDDKSEGRNNADSSKPAKASDKPIPTEPKSDE